MARSQGVAAAAIHRSHHCGAAGHPVERLAEAGLVAIMFVNTPSAIAPWGGSKAGVRHQPDRVCLSPARPRAARDRPVALQGRARQHHDGEAARRENSRRLGARCSRPADHRPGRGARRHHGADGRRQGHGARADGRAAGRRTDRRELRRRGVVLSRRQRPAARHRAVDRGVRSRRVRRQCGARASACWRSRSRRSRARGCRACGGWLRGRRRRRRG